MLDARTLGGVMLALAAVGCAERQDRPPLADTIAEMQHAAEAKEAAYQSRTARANEENDRIAGCVTGTTSYYGAIKVCFAEQSQRLVIQSEEAPETIALAVDAECQAPQGALVRKFLACMSPQDAAAVVDRYAAAMRARVISAVVEHRAVRASQKDLTR